MTFTIRETRLRHLQVPIEHKVVTAFGTMSARHAIVVETEDDDGHVGVGESWINFPHWASAERQAAFDLAFIPYLKGKVVGNEGAKEKGGANIPVCARPGKQECLPHHSIVAFIENMFRAFRGPAVQSGTVGPLLCSLCAIECALWDLAAKRAEVPLNRLLYGKSSDAVRIYASGINAPLPFDLIDAHLDAGVDLFKLKLGFGDDVDRANLDALARHLGRRARIAVDVNRGWTLEQALRWLDPLADRDVVWIEEPLRTEEEGSLSELFARSKVPIALGENVLLEPGCDATTLSRAPAHVLQPDMTKYAPPHVVLSQLPAIADANKRLVPHMLGSAPGFAFSLHVASGLPDPLCELDINRNPLRTEMVEPPFKIVDGRIRLPAEPGIGWRMQASF